MTESQQQNSPAGGSRPVHPEGQQTATGGGASVVGDVDVGGDFTGRDRVTIGQIVYVIGGSRQ
jgi:hypothetical protein